jgi:hypothetical protein
MGLTDFLLRGRRAPTVLRSSTQRRSATASRTQHVAIALDGAAPFGSHAG